MPVTILLRSLGFSEEELLNYFYSAETITYDGKQCSKDIVPDVLVYQRAIKDIKDDITIKTNVFLMNFFFSIIKLERYYIKTFRVLEKCFNLFI